MLSFALASLSVLVGLLMSLRWQHWQLPRLVQDGLHRQLTILCLVFTAVHVLAVWVDPFTHFGLADLLIPFAAAYKPLPMALGIVSLYLLLAVWISSQLRNRIGFARWRQLHYAAFGVYTLGALHGLSIGSDTHALWAQVLYAAGIVPVALLTGLRILGLPARPTSPVASPARTPVRPHS
jgi:predicted ferric reductase